MFKLHHALYHMYSTTVSALALSLLLFKIACAEKPAHQETETPIALPSPTALAEKPIGTLTATPSSIVDTSVPKATSTPSLKQTPIATPSPIITATIRVPSPTATRKHTVQDTPTPIQANSFKLDYPLALTRYKGLHIYHSNDTAKIQIEWIEETYDTVRESLDQVTGIPLETATLYLLEEDQYLEILAKVIGIHLHPEWTQGVAYRPTPSGEGVVFINKAVGALWSASTTEKAKDIWRGENVETTTRKVAAHELTHLALMPYDVPFWLNEGLAKYMENAILPSESILKEKLKLRYSLRSKALNRSLPTIDQLNAKNWIVGATSYRDLASLYELSTGIIWSTIEVPNFTNAADLIATPPDDATLEDLVLSVLNEWLVHPLPEEAAGVLVCKVARQWFDSDKLRDEWNDVIEKNSFDGWDHPAFMSQLEGIIETVNKLDDQTQAEPLKIEFLRYRTSFHQTVFHLLQGENSIAEASRIKSNGHLMSAHTLLESSADTFLTKSCEASIGTNYQSLSD